MIFKKRLILIIACIGCSIIIYAQKSPLTIEELKSWSGVGNGSISDNGMFVYYTIHDRQQGINILTIKSTKSNWTREFINVSQNTFTSDSKKLLFKLHDSLGILELENERLSFIQDVKRFQVANDALIYHKSSDEKTLFIKSLTNNKIKGYNNVVNYTIAPSKESLLLEVNEEENRVLQILNLASNKSVQIWSDDTAMLGNWSWSADGNQLAFLVERILNENKVYELWYFNKGMYNAEKLVSNDPVGIDEGLTLAKRNPQFNDAGDYLFIALQNSNKSVLKVNPEAVQLEVWSYTDDKLYPIQDKNNGRPDFFTAVVNLSSKNVVQLEKENEKIKAKGNDMVLIEKSLGQVGLWEAEYNIEARQSYILVSTHNGSRKLISEGITNTIQKPGLSPLGKWLIYFNTNENNFFSYEVATGIRRNLTENINTTWYAHNSDEPEPSLTWHPSYNTWLKDDEAFLAYDNSDIWLIDPTGSVNPVNITNGYGKKEGIKFTLLETGNDINNLEVEPRSELLLNAFNKNNKERGFFKVNLSSKSNPLKLSMGPYQYGISVAGQDDVLGLIFPFQKAENAKVWLVTRVSATESPNYFFTKDFKTFRQLSNVQPQKEFNWYTTELHSWNALDGQKLQGILYKPEDFDPSKKYPLIFYYYEKCSDGLNLFLHPKPSQGTMNIPLLVSNGYLVFTPDISYKIGVPGQSAYNAIISSANYLSGFEWVDSSKMGLHGHSWGGYQTNYIVAHSNLFAAACSASGMSNMVSWYGSATRGPYAIYHCERSQGRMATTPWEDPESYVNNSPIFLADQVTTPLLMLNNKADHQVPFQQGLELFTALRRLGKKVWMLQYDKGDHSVERGMDAEDFHTRMVQFFDHYLKDKPAPKWMLYGIPAKLKGIEDGLELVNEKDNNGHWITPPEGGVLSLDLKNAKNE